MVRNRTLLLSTALLASGLARAQTEPLTDKTLVAWVSPANLAQRGGSVLTVDDRHGRFDGIVFGELAPACWMAGSDFYRRTLRDQGACAAESVCGGALVQVAIRYAAREVAVFRDGAPYARHEIDLPQAFPAGAVVVLGLRHLDAADHACFAGAIADARIYDRALTPEQIAALRPHEVGDVTPWAWWDFGAGAAVDRTGRFGASTLFGAARVADGRLVLDGAGSYLVASTVAQATESLGAGDAHRNRTARALREDLLRDPYRPGYHFVTPEGVCMPFDPNGAIYWKGRYHLFYIFQDHRGHDWGHVSSADLFHWRHHPTGLVDGMFSGDCFLDAEGRPTMCYHQVGQGNALAVALDDDLDAWQKLASNPITPATRPGDPHHDRYRSWDPYGWCEDGAYYAIFGGTRPAVARASALAGPWRYVGDLFAHGVDGVALDEDVSCADFFELGGKRVLLCISHRLGCRYYVGDWRDEQFHPERHAQMSWVDNSFFAPESLVDDRGRRIMWAWILDGPGFATRAQSGWSGTMSLPRVLELGADGLLRMAPPVEIEALRRDPRRFEDVAVGADDGVVLPGCSGDSLELVIAWQPGDAREVGVEVCRSADGEETTRVSYDAAAQVLKIDTARSSRGDGPRTVEQGPFALRPGEPLQLRVFVDRSVVEVFANDRQAVVRRVYPTRRDSRGVRLFAVGGAATATTVEVFEIAPANPF
ncbi:MAG: GH32 C-terminal domain-containing protein [Planctomycetes bacterium]|nr:GH32 C-terminal domain-containing protein [Planctomycetota bacterium]